MNTPGMKSRTAEKLPQELLDLIIAVNKLPAEEKVKIDGPLQRVIEGTRRRKRILGLVQEALSQLRLDMKYLMFDLEATRRERDAMNKDFDNNDGE